jgi:hypothetical protein
MAALDPDVDTAMTERGSRRREGLAELLKRIGLAENGELLDMLHVLTGFETYDALATSDRSRKDVARILQRAVASPVQGAVSAAQTSCGGAAVRRRSSGRRD